MSSGQMKAYYSILNCRTHRLGSHLDVCDSCGHIEISYNSCRNRHCPKCQTFAKEQWIEKQGQYLLNVGYFHTVFTVPCELNIVFRQNQEIMYNLLFRAVSETLLELGHNPKYLGAKLGFTAILHTWGQNLLYHPHIHCAVPGGGLTDDGRWRYSRKKFFIPVKVLSRKFRGKFLALMRAAKLRFDGPAAHINHPAQYDAFIAALYKKNWVTYCKPPFENAGKVVAYLGRYTHRVAISNSRIISLEDGYVTFSWRDYADGNKVKLMKITAVEFIRRFILHVLPKGLRKIRHYGLLASGGKTKRMRLCQKLTDTPVNNSPGSRKPLEILMDKLGPEFRKCPVCGAGTLIRASPVYA
jgi:ethanolamine utilization protein EutP (predicted NTPase)